jgi:hypothetical protein
MTVEHSLPNRCFPPEITVVPWEDPIVEGPGHWPGDPYIEYCWLGVLGPSTTFLWARLARLGAEAPSTVVDVKDLAISLGLGDGLGASAPLPRSLVRLVQFGCAHGTGWEGLAAAPIGEALLIGSPGPRVPGPGGEQHKQVTPIQRGPPVPQLAGRAGRQP